MKIVKKDGYVYEVEGHGGFETYHTLGKDPNDPRWYEDEKEIELKSKKTKGKKTKKSED